MAIMMAMINDIIAIGKSGYNLGIDNNDSDIIQAGYIYICMYTYIAYDDAFHNNVQSLPNAVGYHWIYWDVKNINAIQQQS